MMNPRQQKPPLWITLCRTKNKEFTSSRAYLCRHTVLCVFIRFDDGLLIVLYCNYALFNEEGDIHDARCTFIILS